MALDDQDADVHRILAALNISTGDFSQAQHHQERALSLNPNYDLLVVQQGELMTWLGRPEEGIEWIRRAMRLNPFHPARYWGHLGRAYFTAKRYAEATEALLRSASPATENLDSWPRLTLDGRNQHRKGLRRENDCRFAQFFGSSVLGDSALQE